jgi:hypothetical protein
VIRREIAGLPYFATSRIYPDGASAASTFERLLDLGRRNQGKLDLGCYRIVPNGIGEPTVIALVSFGRKGIEFAEKVMGGEPTETIEPEAFDSLMARRARVVAPIYKSGNLPESRQLRIKRGTRGARLHRDGTMDEQIGEG